MSASLAFLQGLLSCPALVASVIPSSPYLKDRLCSHPEIAKAKLVVELGPGTGGTTRALLDALPKSSSLIAIEIVPQFVDELKKINDPRLIIEQADALNIREVLAKHHFSQVDVIVSGVPFSTMDADSANKLVGSIYEVIMTNGVFLAYQIRDRISDYAIDFFGIPAVSWVFFNIPPLRLFAWRKIAA